MTTDQQRELRTALSPEERARRQKAVDFARGSVRLEGFVLDDAAERLFARYVAGALSREELNAEVLKLAGVGG